MGLISTGDRYAVASRGPIAIEGAYLWQLKDSIDNTWMDGYRGGLSSTAGGMGSTASNGTRKDIIQTDEDMKRVMEAGSMRCGGCGSKIGGSVTCRSLKTFL